MQYIMVSIENILKLLVQMVIVSNLGVFHIYYVSKLIYLLPLIVMPAPDAAVIKLLL